MSWWILSVFPQYLYVSDFICSFHLPVFSMSQSIILLSKFGMFTTVIPSVEKIRYDDLVKQLCIKWKNLLLDTVCLTYALRGTQSTWWIATQTCWACPCWHLQSEWIELMFLYQNSQNLTTRTKRIPGMIWVKTPWHNMFWFLPMISPSFNQFSLSFPSPQICWYGKTKFF